MQKLEKVGACTQNSKKSREAGAEKEGTAAGDEVRLTLPDTLPYPSTGSSKGSCSSLIKLVSPHLISISIMTFTTPSLFCVLFTI
jgi:hypothetical protein